jgi:hypothetical protein
MVIRIVVAGLLLAHAAIHLAFIAPAPPATASGPAWPFTTADSWLLNRLGVGPAGARLIADGLIAVTLLGFVLAALAALGVVPAALFVPALSVGAVASIGLLSVFFHPWLVLGVAIDLGLLWAGLVAGWTPSSSSFAGS